MKSVFGSTPAGAFILAMILALPAAGGEVPPEILLQDEFSANKLVGWIMTDEGTTYRPSRWTVSKGVLYQLSDIGGPATAPDCAGTFLSHLDGSQWTDYRVAFDLRSDDDDWVGLMFRVRDAENYYRFRWNVADGAIIDKRAGGDTEILASDPTLRYQKFTTYRVEIGIVGDAMVVKVNGVPRLFARDTDLTAGSVAFFSCDNRHSRFDNLLVADLRGRSLQLPPRITDAHLPGVIRRGQSVPLIVTATDPDGDQGSLTYRWTVTPPDGLLTDAERATATYTANADLRAGNYTVNVVVTDVEGLTATRQWSLNVRNAPPEVGVTGLHEVEVGTPVLLDATDTYDPDGDPISFDWRLLRGPEGTAAAIADPTAPSVQFTPDLPGSYFFELRAADDLQLAPPARVVVRARVPADQAFLDELAAMPEGSWKRLNQNSFRSVWPAPDQWPYPDPRLKSGRSDPSRVLTAWSSFAWDSNREQLIFWGGGNRNYTGNEVYLWRLDTRRWERGSLPSAWVLSDGGYGGQIYHYDPVDGWEAAPISSHTYDNQEFFPIADRFVTFGGAGVGYRGHIKSIGTQVVASGPFFLDPSRTDGNKVGGSDGSNVDPVKYPGVLGGHMWENRDSVLSGNINTPNAEYVMRMFVRGASDVFRDGSTEVMLVTDGNSGLWRYTVHDPLDATKDEIMMAGGMKNVTMAHGAGAYDPVRNIFIRTSGPSFYYWNLDVSPSTGPKNNPRQVFPQVLDAGYPTTRQAEHFGFVYDPPRDRFLLWNGLRDVWILTPPPFADVAGWTLAKAAVAAGSTEYPTTGAGVGIFGKWKYAEGYDVFFGVGHSPHSGDIWVYKPHGWAPPR